MRVDALPSAGETVTDGIFTQAFGGKGANQAVAASRSGGDVIFVSALEDDALANEMLSSFRRDGIHVDHVLQVPNSSTGCALITVDQQGENCISVAPGANRDLTPSYVESVSRLFADAQMIVLQLEIPISSVQKSLELAKRFGTPTMLNYAPVRNCELSISDLIGILVVNEHEAAALSGLPVKNVGQAHRAANALRSLGPETVIVTLGSRGVYFDTSTSSGHVPAFSVKPIDTTAAGDTFCGTLAVALVEGKPIESAIRFASAASAICVTHVGAQPSIPNRQEIETFLHEH